jgi:hypothetical protein
MGLGSVVSKLFRSDPPALEVVGEITEWGADPHGDGKSAAFRISSKPEMEFRQRTNVLSSVHRRGEQVKVVYSLTPAGIGTVDYVTKI